MTQWFNINTTAFQPTACLLVATAVDAATGATASLNYVAYAVPGALVAPPAVVTASVASAPNADGTVDVTLATDAPAAYVVLTTLAQGRFSDNAVLLLPPGGTLQFIPFGGAADIALLASSLHVDHLYGNQYGH